MSMHHNSSHRSFTVFIMCQTPYFLRILEIAESVQKNGFNPHAISRQMPLPRPQYAPPVIIGPPVGPLYLDDEVKLTGSTWRVWAVKKRSLRLGQLPPGEGAERAEHCPPLPSLGNCRSTPQRCSQPIPRQRQTGDFNDRGNDVHELAGENCVPEICAT